MPQSSKSNYSGLLPRRLLAVLVAIALAVEIASVAASELSGGDSGARAPAASAVAISQPTVPLISPQRLIERVQSGESVVFVDVREPEEFAEGHIPGAVNIPQRDLGSRIGELDPDALTIPYCNMDFRGFVAAKRLRDLGIRSVALMQERGLRGWEAQSLPVSAGSAQSEEDGLRRLREVAARDLLGDRFVENASPTGRSHRIEMVASEWFFDPNDLEIEAGDTIHLTIRSEKGNHFFIQPDYEISVYLPEGETREVQFQALRPGDYRFGSCEWDGTSLQVMKGRLRVVAPPS